MDSLQNIISLLKPTGLYNLTDSYVLCELKAEAAGLDMLETAMEELIAEAFPATASGFGLTLYEKILKLGAIPEETVDRRSRIVRAVAMNAGDNTVEKLINCLRLYGVAAAITEDFVNEKILITGKGYNLGFTSPEEIGKNLLHILPAHLGIDLTLHVGTWYFWNQKKLSFYDLKNNAYEMNDLAAMGDIIQSY